MKIRFACKDPELAEHYDRKFRAQFEEEFAETDLPLEAYLASWYPQMTAEALHQEHWDYNNHGGHRIPVMGSDGRPTLLVPTIVFE